MKGKSLITLVLVAQFLTLAPLAVASNWYVNGASGRDSNGCTSPTTACKTIKHAISLASSGDSIMVAAATYRENLTIGISLKLIGSGSNTTIIDGGYVNTVVTISNATTHVLLSQVTIQRGAAFQGGDIYNNGIGREAGSSFPLSRTWIGETDVSISALTFTNKSRAEAT